VSNDRYENDAEHSWHICIMAIALQKYSNRKVSMLTRISHTAAPVVG
jgi:5'-deoxynucleotidase YfbR-like HD superfamily hydrolase